MQLLKRQIWIPRSGKFRLHSKLESYAGVKLSTGVDGFSGHEPGRPGNLLGVRASKLLDHSEHAHWRLHGLISKKLVSKKETFIVR